MVKKTRTTLTNGLPLVVIEIPDSKSLVTTFWTKAGNRIDPDGKLGMAHLMEHLLLKKTKSYPSDFEFGQVLEKVGASKNGTTAKDWLNFNITSSSKDFELTTRVLSEMVLNPLITKSGFENERKVVLEENSRRRTHPENSTWDIWFKIFMANSPINCSTLGTVEGIKAINLSDTLKFWGQKMLRKDSILVFSGGVDSATIHNLCEKFFGSHSFSSDLDVPTYDYKSETRIVIEKNDAPQTNMIMSFRIPGGQIYDDYYALLVLRGILCLGWSSRITQRLRVKEALIYGNGSNLHRYFDIGAFTFNLGSSKAKFSKMVSVLCEEIVKFREDGITEKELQFTKGYMEGLTSRTIETSWDYIDWYAFNELYWPENAESPEERLEKLKSVTKEEVERVAKKYLTNDNWQLAVVGDVKEEELKVEL